MITEGSFMVQAFWGLLLLEPYYGILWKEYYINGRSSGSNRWRYVSTLLYHIFGHIFWGYSLKNRPEK